jgi:hypothetical protein
VPEAVRRFALRTVARTFGDPVEAVRWDVAVLRAAPLMRRDIPIHGLVSAGSTVAVQQCVQQCV